MTNEERIIIARNITVISMWGHGWIGSTLMEKLDKEMPHDPSWSELYRQNWKRWNREHVGVLDDQRKLDDYLRRGYWLANWDEDGCALFNPAPMNGLAMYVDKKLAEQHKWEPRP